jgi:hypothetical protein
MSRALRGFLLAALVICHPGPVLADQVLDQFDDVSGWSATSSSGVTVALAPDAGHTGGALRVDFDFHGIGGYVIVHKAFPMPLPENYAFKFDLRGTAPPNTLEFKLLDASGENVWWNRRRDFVFPADWQQIVVKRTRLRFAWGPAGTGLPRAMGALDIAITAGTGGAGSVWLDDLRLEEREPVEHDGWRPKVTASSALPGQEPALAADDDPDTSWRSDGDGPQWVVLDLSKRREFGGLVIDWDPDAYATSYRVEGSDDAETWISAYTNTTGSGRRDYVYMPDAEWRYVRLLLDESNADLGYGIREITVKPTAFSESVNDFFAAVAADSPVGTYPKYLLGRQSYWTVVGTRDDDAEALVNEEGAIEADNRAFTIEPFLYAKGALITWGDAHLSQELANGMLPIPTVIWRHDALTLRTTAWAAGPPGGSTLYVRYRVENASEAPEDVRLFVAVRPFQVLPPWQSLNIQGGVTPIHVLDFDGRAVHVDGGRAVVSLTPPARFGAASFAQSLTANFLRRGVVPPETEVSDAFGYASGALEYPLSVPGGGAAEVHVALPMHNGAVVPGPALDPSAFDSFHDRTRAEWTSRLGRVEFQVSPADAKFADALKTTIAYMLINRDGPALQPGSRTYARSWIRDGALTATALLETGSTEEAREFLEWYAQYQLPNGRIPCCIDRRGADPVAEHDSDGEFIYTVAEYYRYTHDVGFVQEMWPPVTRALDSIAALRAQTITEASAGPEKDVFYGLMPASISHEGYSSHPVHSYWDDFFALRGLKDGAMLASVVGDDERATNTATLRDEFRSDLYASIEKAMALHQIDYIPGSVELGDFDPTSTAMAITACGELDHLPQPALTRTFDRYYEHMQQYFHDTSPGEGYSPYELRNVEVFVRLGQRDRATDVLAAMVADQRPEEWNEWQEVVWRDPAVPRFIGDMPHTWVGAGYVHSLRAMFAYEREDDRTLVLAAGLPWDWIASDRGAGVKRLPTHYGVLSYTIRAEEPNTVRVKLAGDLSGPTIIVEPPLPQPLKAVTVNGKPSTAFDPTRATINQFPADVVLEY